MTSERLEVARTIEAAPDAVFRVLCDPQGHVAIDSTGMLMDATGEPVTAAGDTFVVHMDREALNDYPLSRYDVTVTITTLVPDREIAWTIRGNPITAAASAAPFQVKIRVIPRWSWSQAPAGPRRPNRRRSP